MTKLHFLTSLSFGVHSPRRSPYRALLSDNENKRFIIIVLREEPHQADGRLGKALQHVVNRIWDKNNPFSWGDESPSHRVVAIEIEWSAIVGIDYRCPLHDDGKLVLEARQVVKRCFKTVEDVRDFYSPRAATVTASNVLRSFHSAAPTPQKVSFEGWQASRPSSCAAQRPLVTGLLSPRALGSHSRSQGPCLAGLARPLQVAEGDAAAGPALGSSGLPLDRASVSGRGCPGGPVGASGLPAAGRGRVEPPPKGFQPRSLSTSRMGRSTGMLGREDELTLINGVGGAASCRGSCLGFASADECLGASRRQPTATGRPSEATCGAAVGAGCSGSGAHVGAVGRAVRRKLKLSGQVETAVNEAERRFEAGPPLAAWAHVENHMAVAPTRAEALQRMPCQGSVIPTTDIDSASASCRKTRSHNDLVGMVASSPWGTEAEADLPSGGGGDAADVLPSWYVMAPGEPTYNGVEQWAGGVACFRGAFADGSQTRNRRPGCSCGSGDWQADSGNGTGCWGGSAQGNNGSSILSNSGLSGSSCSNGSMGVAMAGASSSSRREQSGGRSARTAKAGEQARWQRGGGARARGVWAGLISEDGGLGTYEGVAGASSGVEVPRASRWTRPSASYTSSTLVLSFRDPFLPQELRRFVKSDIRLLKLYESGLPPWAVLMPCYGLPYRPWMRRALWLLFIAVSIFSMGCGFYDLYKNVPFLKQVVTAVASRMYLPASELFEWLERHTQIRMSILLTYLFSKSPLLMSLMRMLRSLAALLQQILRPLVAALSAALQPLGAALQVAVASVGGGAAAIAAAAWRVAQPIVAAAAVYGSQVMTLAAAVLGPPARALWAMAVLVAQLMRLTAALVGMVLVGPLQLACSIAQALSWAGAEAAEQLTAAWDALLWAVRWVVTLGRAAQRVAPAVKAGARVAAQAAGGASAAVGGVSGGFSGGMAVWQWLGLEVVGAYNAVRLTFLQALKSAQAVMNFCVTVVQTAVQHRVSLLLQIQRFITRQKERLPPAVAASVPLPAFVTLPSFDMNITDLLGTDAEPETEPGASATSAERALYGMKGVIHHLDTVRQGPSGAGAGSNSGPHGAVVSESEQMYGSDVAVAGWRATGGGGGGGGGDHEPLPIPIPQRPGRSSSFGGALRRRHVSAENGSAGSAGAMHGMMYGRLDSVDEEELDEESFGFDGSTQRFEAATAHRQSGGLSSRESLAGAGSGSLPARQHAATIGPAGRLLSCRLSGSRQRILVVPGGVQAGWHAYGRHAWPASAPGADFDTRWAAAARGFPAAQLGGPGGDRATSAGGLAGALLGPSLLALPRRHSADGGQRVAHERALGPGVGPGCGAAVPLPGEASLAVVQQGSRPRKHSKQRHSQGQQESLPQQRKLQHGKQQKHVTERSGEEDSSLSAPTGMPGTRQGQGSAPFLGRATAGTNALAASLSGGKQGVGAAAGAAWASAVLPAGNSTTSVSSAATCREPAVVANANGAAHAGAHTVKAESAALGVMVSSVARQRRQPLGAAGGSTSTASYVGGVVVLEGSQHQGGAAAERAGGSAAQQGRNPAAAGDRGSGGGDSSSVQGGNSTACGRPLLARRM